MIETNGIPICPKCNKPTKRTGGQGSVTSAYYPPIYDENGVNTNPDRNTITTGWHCIECGTDYTVSGNVVDGFDYISNYNISTPERTNDQPNQK